MTAVNAAVEQFGLTAAALSAMPDAWRMHDADLPRVAIYSSWNSTQEIGWYRHAFDQFGIPFDLIFKERAEEGEPARRLRRHRDADAAGQPRQAVFAPPAARPVPYLKTDKYKFLGDYGSSPDITGGMGGDGVDAFAKFLDGGGTLICTGNAVQFPTELGHGAHGRRVRIDDATLLRAAAARSTPRSSSRSTRCSTATPRRSFRSSTSADR